MPTTTTLKVPPVVLSPAQSRLAKDLLVAHESMGDCTLRGNALHFDDFEGFQAVRNGIFQLSVCTEAGSRSYISAKALIRKLDRYIRRW